jgi:MbtH protein
VEHANRERAMSESQEPQAETYRVVVNEEEQYSIWAAGRELPAGWADAGKSGTREECLAHIESVWVDMRPLSLRTRMAAAAR